VFRSQILSSEDRKDGMHPAEDHVVWCQYSDGARGSKDLSLMSSGGQYIYTSLEFTVGLTMLSLCVADEYHCRRHDGVCTSS